MRTEDACPVECGDNSCICAGPHRAPGMRTNGGCRCYGKGNTDQGERNLAQALRWWRKRAEDFEKAHGDPDGTVSRLRELERQNAALRCELAARKFK